MDETDQKKEIKKLLSAPIYKENPFINEMVGEMKIKHKKQMIRSTNKDTEVMLVNQDGENVGHSAFIREIQVDEDKFAKLYISQLAALWGLTKTSLKVLSYILHSLRPNEDGVYFNFEECMSFCEYKDLRSVYDGILGLINADIIARTKRNYFYYINPRIVFNGSRVTFMTTYVKKKKQLMLENPAQISLLDQPGVIQGEG